MQKAYRNPENYKEGNLERRGMFKVTYHRKRPTGLDVQWDHTGLIALSCCPPTSGKPGMRPVTSILRGYIKSDSNPEFHGVNLSILK